MFKSSNRTFFLALAVVAAALAGCAGNTPKPSASSMPNASSENGSGINTSGTGNSATGNGQSLSSKTGPDLSQHSIYFAFNKSAIEPQYQSVIDNWSKYLLANPTVHVQLQGNTDERGTQAYNVALGENRADSVRQAMESEGVGDSQLSVISYGEERPVCTEHDEACWKQNRRTDIVQQ